MSTTHTPGPWELDYDKGSTQDILSRKHGGICTVRRAGRHDNATFAANARLIAAAPELLAALENIVGLWADSEQNNGLAQIMARDAQTAIARVKATT